MVLGIGIDIVQIARLEGFNSFSKERLMDIFSDNELLALKEAVNKNQFMASRFAAKEAFYKAFSVYLVNSGFNKKNFSFQFARKNVEVVKVEWDVPSLVVNWNAFEEKLGIKIPSLKLHVSLSHEKEYAVAVVVLDS